VHAQVRCKWTLDETMKILGLFSIAKIGIILRKESDPAGVPAETEAFSSLPAAWKKMIR